MKKVENCLALGATGHRPNGHGGCYDCQQPVKPVTLSRLSDAPDRRRVARLIPESRGRGLGQQTGGNWSSDEQEARKLIAMTANVPLDTILQAVSYQAYRIVEEYRHKLALGRELEPTGKQVFFLRDIKDKLLEKGLL